MHLMDISVGMMLSLPIVASVIPIAVGAAMSKKINKSKTVVVVFFGDAAVEEGVFHESANFASLRNLPILFVCENNNYMEYTPIESITAVKNPAADRASAYGLDSIIIDGNDADEVYRTAQVAYSKARSGEGPSLIECKTYRQSGHSRADPGAYRPDGELDHWKKNNDTITRYRSRLIEFGVKQKIIDGIEENVKRVVDEATEEAKSSPVPPEEILTTNVYANGGWAWRN